MRTFLIVVSLAGMAVSCSQHEEAKGVFTLATGVSVISASACSEVPSHRLDVSKSAADYIVVAAGTFACNPEIKAPYLSLPRDKKATLVLNSTSESTCDCFRTVTVGLAGRLKPGDILYVLNNGEVLGHAVMP